MILPAVFKEVYRQLEESDLVMDAYGDEEEEEDVGNNGEIKSLRLRTRITTSVLTSILTLSYVVSGGIRVVGKCYWVWLRFVFVVVCSMKYAGNNSCILRCFNIHSCTQTKIFFSF